MTNAYIYAFAVRRFVKIFFFAKIYKKKNHCDLDTGQTWQRRPGIYYIGFKIMSLAYQLNKTCLQKVSTQLIVYFYFCY